MAQRIKSFTQQLLPGAASIATRQTTSQSYSASSILATRKQLKVLDSHMSYLDTGATPSGHVVVFLHGNPTQAYLWRNIIGHVAPAARCVAPDLIGMGQSGKIKSNYRFVDHFKYLSAWIEAMQLPKELNFVIHDWGSGLGFHWCNLHRDRVRSITYMEALVSPMRTWEDFPETSREFFRALRTDAGEKMVLDKNLFVKLLLPAAILRDLTEHEMDVYTAPFKEQGESRRPTLTWPREIPILEAGPPDVCQFAADYSQWLAQSEDVPKLYIRADPGFFTAMIDVVVRDWPNNRQVTVQGHHFLQEDSPDEIGVAVRDFIQTLDQ